MRGLSRQTMDGVTVWRVADGPTLIVRPDRAHSVTACRCYVLGGSIAEWPHGGSGAAHLLEHAIATLALGELQRRALGALLNAFVARDHVCLAWKTVPEDAAASLAVVLEQFRPRALDADADGDAGWIAEIDTQRRVLVEELRLHERNPLRVFRQQFLERLLLIHPARYPVSGHTDGVRALDAAAVDAYRRRVCRASHLCIVATGACVPERLLDTLLESPLDLADGGAWTLPAEAAEPRRTFDGSFAIDGAAIDGATIDGTVAHDYTEIGFVAPGSGSSAAVALEALSARINRIDRERRGSLRGALDGVATELAARSVSTAFDVGFFSILVKHPTGAGERVQAIVRRWLAEVASGAADAATDVTEVAPACHDVACDARAGGGLANATLDEQTARLGLSELRERDPLALERRLTSRARCADTDSIAAAIRDHAAPHQLLVGHLCARHAPTKSRSRTALGAGEINISNRVGGSASRSTQARSTPRTAQGAGEINVSNGASKSTSRSALAKSTPRTAPGDGEIDISNGAGRRPKNINPSPWERGRGEGLLLSNGLRVLALPSVSPLSCCQIVGFGGGGACRVMTGLMPSVFLPFCDQHMFGLSLTGTTEDLHAGVDLLLDCVMEPRCAAPDVDIVRERLARALRSPPAHWDWDDRAIAELRRALFGDRLYGRGEAGTADALQRLTPGDVVTCHRELCAGANLVVVVSGQAATDTLIEHIATRLRDLPPGVTPVPVRTGPPTPGVSKSRTDLPLDAGAMAWLALGYRGIAWDLRDWIALELARTLMVGPTGGLATGRLIDRLRREGLAYHADCLIRPGACDGSVSVLTTFGHGDVDRVMTLIDVEIEALRAGRFTAAEFAFYGKLLLLAHTMLYENPRRQAFLAAHHTLLSGDTGLSGDGGTWFRVPDAIAAASRDDVVEVCTRLLVESNKATVRGVW